LKKDAARRSAAGRLVAVAISVMVSEEVLLAKIVDGAGRVHPSAPKSSRLAGSCSMMCLDDNVAIFQIVKRTWCPSGVREFHFFGLL